MNRSLDTDILADIHLAGFRAGSRAEIEVLHGSSIDDANDEDEPEHVIPLRTEARVMENSLRHVFPNKSVTLIAFHRNR